MSSTKVTDRLRAARSELLKEADIRVVQNQSLIDDRRKQICDAATELFLEKGFAATTIRDICARSNVNQASIYDYIANKNDILRRVLNQLWFREDVQMLPEILLDDSLTLREAIERFLRQSWQVKRKGTLLAYRCIPHLLPEDRKALRIREAALMKDLSDQLHRRLGLHDEDPRLDVLSNLVVFLQAFGPMRDWLHSDIPDETVLRTVSAAAAAMIESVADT